MWWIKKSGKISSSKSKKMEKFETEKIKKWKNFGLVWRGPSAIPRNKCNKLVSCNFATSPCEFLRRPECQASKPLPKLFRISIRQPNSTIAKDFRPPNNAGITWFGSVLFAFRIVFPKIDKLFAAIDRNSRWTLGWSHFLERIPFGMKTTRNPWGTVLGMGTHHCHSCPSSFWAQSRLKMIWNWNIFQISSMNFDL